MNLELWWIKWEQKRKTNHNALFLGATTTQLLYPTTSKPNKSIIRDNNGQRPEISSHHGSHWSNSKSSSSIWWWMISSRRLRRRSKRMNKNRNFHAIEALAIATNEVIPLGLIKKYEILAWAPIPCSSFCGAVVITSLIHLKHIVLVLLVPKC